MGPGWIIRLFYASAHAIKKPPCDRVVLVMLAWQQVLINLFRTVFRYFAIRRMPPFIAFKKYT